MFEGDDKDNPDIGPRWLVIEDEANDALTVRSMLRRVIPTPRIAFARTLARALDLISEGHVSGDSFVGILVDLNLPDSMGDATFARVSGAAGDACVVAKFSGGSVSPGVYGVEFRQPVEAREVEALCSIVAEQAAENERLKSALMMARGERITPVVSEPFPDVYPEVAGDTLKIERVELAPRDSVFPLSDKTVGRLKMVGTAVGVAISAAVAGVMRGCF